MTELEKDLVSIEKYWLDWVNNFLTVERFAEYYNISLDHAHSLINAGKEANNILIGLGK